jgi:hypothetical protein
MLVDCVARWGCFKMMRVRNCCCDCFAKTENLERQRPQDFVVELSEWQHPFVA